MEMKIAVFLACLGLVLLVNGCTPIEKVYVCPDGRQVQDPASCTPADAPRQEVKVEETESKVTGEVKPSQAPDVEDVKGVSGTARDTLLKSEKASTLRFLYAGPDRLVPDNIYTATRTNMRVELKTKMQFAPNERYDIVYLDFQARTAKGYCEQLDSGICPDRNKAYNLDFSSYSLMTPFDWLTGMQKADFTGQTKRIDGRTGKEVDFSMGGKTGKAFIDSYYGIPLEVTYDGGTYLYRNLIINEYSADLTVHQYIEE